MFALDHCHYARCMTIRVSGLLALENTCPTTHAQVHKQLNAMAKRNGYGIMGITKNETALRHWMVAGPETARLSNEYEDKHSMNKKDPNIIMYWYPMYRPTSNRSIVSLMWSKNLPIHFLINIYYPYTLDTKVIMPHTINMIKTSEDIGKIHVSDSLKICLNDHVTALNDTIRKTIYLCPPLVQLFSIMSISSQARDRDLDAFFQHEKHAWPPQLAWYSIMHQAKNKSVLVECLGVISDTTRRYYSYRWQNCL